MRVVLAAVAALGCAPWQSLMIAWALPGGAGGSRDIEPLNGTADQAALSFRTEKDDLTWAERKAPLAAGLASGLNLPSGSAGVGPSLRDICGGAASLGELRSLVSLRCLLTV